MLYNDLTQTQTENFWHLLEYAQKNQLDALKEIYPDIIRRRDLDLYRNNLLDFIMMNQIDFANLDEWLNSLKENCNNTIVHLEYISINQKKKTTHNNLHTKLNEHYVNILDVERNSLKDPKITLLNKTKNDLEITITVPAIKLKEEKSITPFSNNKKVLIQQPALYFIYIWFDISNNCFTVSLPPTKDYYSVWGITTKKNLADILTRKSLDFMEEIIGDIELTSPKWVNKALRQITQDYYYHNNPEVEAELNKINTIKKKNELKENNINPLENYISNLSSIFNNEVVLQRINKGLEKILEKELIAHFGLNPCRHPFEVFLQEVNKGDTTFHSRNGYSNNEKNIPSLATRDTILSILDSGSLKAIGLKYYSKSNETVPYKFICKDDWFILEQTNEARTAKELAKNVLAEFKNYKGSESTLNERTKSTT